MLKYFVGYYIKNYDYILVDIGGAANKKIKQKMIKISDKKILVIINNLLGINEVKKLNSKTVFQTKNEKESLHIILNKYYFNTISKSIFKNIIKPKIKFNILFYNKKFQNKKIRLNLFLKHKLKNILK